MVGGCNLEEKGRICIEKCLLLYNEQATWRSKTSLFTRQSAVQHTRYTLWKECIGYVDEWVDDGFK
tara:strand:- start:66 stop:263 length:198 start_codon:yes stop_codon:yes gene_type:complete